MNEDRTPTPHNSARKGQIAETVLLPGDPLRARYIAENYLSDAELVTSVRGMEGWTGNYNGKKVTVMGSGMGSASCGLYSYELYKFYDVENIIRIGTAGGYQEFMETGDLVFAMTSSTDSNYAGQYELPGTFSPSGSFELLEKAVSYARENKIRFHVGGIFSSDYFSQYNARGWERAWKPWARMGCLAQDMETYALYCNAAFLGKKALSIVTNVHSLPVNKGGPCSPEALDNMIRTALSLV